MHTVVAGPAFLRQAKAEAMTDAELQAAIDIVSATPEAGEMIVGSGGRRKIRIAGRGKGKSGGYRMITGYGGDAIPAVLLQELYKGSDANVSAAQVNALKGATAVIAKSLGPRAIGP